jgi:hypothetical protein
MQSYMLELVGRERMADYLRDAERAGLAARARRARATRTARPARHGRGRVAPAHQAGRVTA